MNLTKELEEIGYKSFGEGIIKAYNTCKLIIKEDKTGKHAIQVPNDTTRKVTFFGNLVDHEVGVQLAKWECGVTQFYEHNNAEAEEVRNKEVEMA